MKNIVGQIASKENFFFRERIIKRILQRIEAGENIQLSAPRRVGKSSILYYLKDNPQPGFIFIYIDVESARSKQEFYRKVYKEVLKNESLGKKNILQQLKEGTNKVLSRLKNIKIGPIGEIAFNEQIEVDYEEELLNFLAGVDLEHERLVIMIDEFPEVLLNMQEDENGAIKSARSFLQSNREFRNNSELKTKVQFIYTGSNSLNVTASFLNSTELINDLNTVSVEPLSTGEAQEFVLQILENYQLPIEPDILDHMVKQVQWLIPFYFQLLIQEIICEINPGEKITKELINSCADKIVEQKNDHHFEHYVKRLKRIFTPDQLKFVKAFLSQLCRSEQISMNEILNLSHGIIGEDEVKRVLRSLMHDGYIIGEDSSRQTFYFNSPILKIWWSKHES